MTESPPMLQIVPGLMGWRAPGTPPNRLMLAGYDPSRPDAWRLKGSSAEGLFIYGVVKSRVHQETRGYAAVVTGRYMFRLRQGYHFHLLDDRTLNFPALGWTAAAPYEERKFWHPYTAPVHVGPVDLDAVRRDLERRQPTWFVAVRPRDIIPLEFKDSPRFRRYVAHLARRHHIDSGTLFALRGIFSYAEAAAQSLAHQRRLAYSDYLEDK